MSSLGLLKLVQRVGIIPSATRPTTRTSSSSRISVSRHFSSSTQFWSQTPTCSYRNYNNRNGNSRLLSGGGQWGGATPFIIGSRNNSLALPYYCGCFQEQRFLQVRCFSSGRRKKQRTKKRLDSATREDEDFFLSEKLEPQNQSQPTGNSKNRRRRALKKRSKAKHLELQNLQPQAGGAIVDLSQFTTPLNRPVMTEHLAQVEDTFFAGQLGLDNTRSQTNAKSILYETKSKLGHELRIHHSSIKTEIPGGGVQDLFLATMTTQFAHGKDMMELWKTMKKESDDWDPSLEMHPHAQIITTAMDKNDNDDGSHDKAQKDSSNAMVEFVTMGAAPTKKKAELLAAMDALAVLHEMGVEDVKNPPNLVQTRMDQARKLQSQLQAQAKEHAQELYKNDLAKAQMLLEILGGSKPKFQAEMVEGAKNVWTATVSLHLRGNLLSITGNPAPRKAQAEGNALIALVESPELEDIVGKQAIELYHQLMKASPADHIVALRIPPIADDFLESMQKTVGTKQEQVRREKLHFLAREEFEWAFEEQAQQQQQQSGRKHRKKRYHQQPERVNAVLQQEEERRATKVLENPTGKEATMKQLRDALPISQIRQGLIDALESQQVIVVSGGTGSGKSTQCPQYILEDAIAKGKGVATQILVTQPRKIAAISVAERVADERCENIGNAIGYTVRFKRQSPREQGGTIEFVTTGILLRRLIQDPNLSDISHVMIDEVHERDINTDFLLVLLRDLLKARPDLRVILMSATLDAQSFSDYFSHVGAMGQVPLLSVPAQPRHPVDVIYLEDLSKDASSAYSNEITDLAESLLLHNDRQLKSDLEEALEEEEAADQLQAVASAEDVGDTLQSDSDSESSSDSESDTEDDNNPNSSRRKIITANRVNTLRKAWSLRNSRGRQSLETKKVLPDKFDPLAAVVSLVTKVSAHLCKEELEQGRSGSILCFLPGWDEIKASTEEMEDLVESDRHFQDKITVLPLHSTIPHEDQQKVFAPAEDKVKVIFATNIAESSITIDDVLAVVDSGLVRELNYDAESAMSSMETNRTSTASSTQRLGRAGRVAPGRCYRLFSRSDFEAMPPRATPEIQRTALEATCLQTCSMTSKGVEQFLGQALDPPPEEAVSQAMDRLVKLDAINVSSTGETLTPLGRCLSRLPLDPATGRMLFMGVVMRCLDPLLTTAACFSSSNTFYNPPGLRNEAGDIRKSFSETSDIMATIKAYDKFWALVDEEGWKVAREWAMDRFVSISAMVSIRAVRSQLLDELNKIGMIPHADFERTVGRNRRNSSLRWDASVNENADNDKLYTAIWSTAFPGNLAARRKIGGDFGTLRTRLSSHAGLHPSSVAFHRKPPRREERRKIKLPSWYLYREMVLSSQAFIRGNTGLEPEQILLFGGYRLNPLEEDETTSSGAHGVLDDWIVVEGSCPETVDLLIALREEMNRALERKVMAPKEPLPASSQDLLDCISDLLDPPESDGEDSD